MLKVNLIKKGNSLSIKRDNLKLHPPSQDNSNTFITKTAKMSTIADLFPFACVKSHNDLFS
jgi:hypothetical protein